jgi:rRNA-processing protein FCF1
MTRRVIRIVLDTNTIVSALLQPLGPPGRVFLLAINRSIQFCISGNVYAEYEEVIRRPRLRRDENVIAPRFTPFPRRPLGQAHGSCPRVCRSG